MKSKRSTKTASTEDFDAWQARLSVVIRQDRHAARSWKRLSNAGLDMEEASCLLWLACDFDGSPGYEFISKMADAVKEHGKEAAQLARRLTTDVATIKRVCGGHAETDLLGKLESLIAKLHAVSRESQQSVSKRKWNPSIYLGCLVKTVKEQTKQPYYEEVTDLLDAAYEAHGQEAPNRGADAVRKSYSRYSRNPPIAWDPDPLSTILLAISLSIGVLLKSTKESKANRQPADAADAIQRKS